LKIVETSSFKLSSSLRDDPELGERQHEKPRSKLKRTSKRQRRGKFIELGVTREQQADICFPPLRLAEVGTKESDANTLAQATDMLNDVIANLELLDSASAEARAASILSGLGFSQEMRDGPYSALSGGWRSRCSLAT
jgi:hypothetical protein